MRQCYSFNRSERLHLQRDFRRVFKTGRRLAHPAVFIYTSLRPDGTKTRRLGLVTSRKVGGAAERNRVKRRLREIFRLNKYGLAEGIDIIFVPRPGISKLNFAELKKTVLGLLQGSGVFTQNT
jgi:ribonuclease P protein component